MKSLILLLLFFLLVGCSSEQFIIPDSDCPNSYESVVNYIDNLKVSEVQKENLKEEIIGNFIILEGELKSQKVNWQSKSRTTDYYIKQDGIKYVLYTTFGDNSFISLDSKNKIINLKGKNVKFNGSVDTLNNFLIKSCN